MLLVAPTSVLSDWLREAKAFTPELGVVEHYGPHRPSTPAALAKKLEGIDRCSPATACCSATAAPGQPRWQGVVIDKTQAIETSSARRSRRPGTGTPAQAEPLPSPSPAPRWRPGERLWALMDFLNPKVLGEEKFFRQRYRLPIERYGDMAWCTTSRRGWVRSCRRLKTDHSIISDLPEKVELKRNGWGSQPSR